MFIRRRVRKEKWGYLCRKKRLLQEKLVRGIKKRRKNAQRAQARLRFFYFSRGCPRSNAWAAFFYVKGFTKTKTHDRINV